MPDLVELTKKTKYGDTVAQTELGKSHSSLDCPVG